MRAGVGKPSPPLHSYQTERKERLGGDVGGVVDPDTSAPVIHVCGHRSPRKDPTRKAMTHLKARTCVCVFLCVSLLWI